MAGGYFVFPHVDRYPDLLRPELPAGFFASQVLLPIVGIALYVVAALLGRLVHPLVAVGIFAAVVGYDAWTGQGLDSRL
jgi:hypothetical protein